RAEIIRPIVQRAIARIRDLHFADLYSDFAEQIPIRVICELMGLPSDDRWIEGCQSLMYSISKFLNSQFTRPPEVLAEARRASAALNDYLRPSVLARQRPEDRSDDLISRLWIDGPNLLPPWAANEVLANTRLMLFGGTDTTTHTIANAIHLLATRLELK